MDLGKFRTWGFDNFGWAESTRALYARRVAAADRWLRERYGIPAARATQEQLMAWMSSLPATPASRNLAGKALTAYRQFVRRPVNLPRIPEHPPVPRALESRESRALWRTAKRMGPEYAVPLGLMLFAGLRIGEVRTLRWQDVREDAVIVRGKGNRERSVPLHPALKSWLTRIRSLDPLWVCPSPRYPGQPISMSGLRGRMMRLGEAAGVRWHCHQARHAFATDLLRTGADLRLLQEGLGHATIATTQRYLRVWPGRLAHAIARLPYDEAA